ncbi:MAG: UDP-N-acetylmuramate dehydrogenase [Clostridia bacterium]|nr:UDP-N-acetylmuramate dehydrogenase [Clostridia bacterium]
MVYKSVCELCDNLSIEYKIFEKTTKLVSIQVGGTASLVVYPKTINQFVRILDVVLLRKHKHYILGNGTNTYFSDKNFNGILIVTKRINKCYVDNEQLIAECGTLLFDCCELALKNSLSGMEFAYGIPATIGGALYMNASAFGSSISTVVKKTLVYDTSLFKTYYIFDDEHLFEEKKSVFSDKKHLIVLETVFELKRGLKFNIESLMNTYLTKRISTQPLEFPSAGSVFKKPKNNHASQLIDLAGLKGTRVGGAEVSKKHAGFIINVGEAKANDIQSLISIIKERIYNEFKVKLEEEIIFVE